MLYSAYINKNALSYTLSENLSSASIVFTQTDGQPDPNSPQTIDLTGNELYTGKFSEVMLNNGPNLFNGSIYKVEFSGIDFANNESNLVLIENLHYDDEAPEISISRPINSEQIKSTVVSYITSEDLLSANVIFSHFKNKLSLPSKNLDPATLENILDSYLEDSQIKKIKEIIRICDAGRYSFESNEKRKTILKDVNDILVSIDKDLQ